MLNLFKNRRGKKIHDLLGNLEGSLRENNIHSYCHLDPDLIRENLNRVNGWRGLFGPHPKYQKHFGSDVKENDLFLFFGTFRHVIIERESLRYAKKNDGDHLLHKGTHIIYGYLQVSKVITDSESIKPWMYEKNHHPHLDAKLWNVKNNALYIANDKLVLNGETTNLQGWRLFDFKDDLVLTENNKTKSVWKRNLFPPDSIIKHMGKPIDQKNWNKEGCFSWKTFGQEFILEDCPKFEKHVIENIFGKLIQS